jgi:REP element-mobilizing transposase RayT
VHLLIKPNDDENVFKLIGGMRGYSARACNLLRDRTGQAFWMEDSYNRMVRDYDELRGFRDYIRRNPVEAELRDAEFTLIENHVLK